MGIISSLLLHPEVVLGGIGALLIALFGAVGFGMVKGATKERNKAAADRLDAIKDKKEKDNEVQGLSDGDLNKRFDRWMR